VLARRLDWAALLLRVFAIDVLECPKCEGRMRILAVITDPDAVERILEHFELPTEPPRSSRDPPGQWWASA
jgi:23S rRNA U2552 (ribose-2'-O)-methylase RlmE/FtsJ